MKSILLLATTILHLTWATAQNNYALSFNGSSNLDCSNPAAFNISGHAITVEAWIYPTAFGANYWDGSIIAKDALTVTGYVLRCGGTGRLSLVIGVTGNVWVEAVSSNNALTLNQWQHVAGVYNGTTLVIYVNGIPVQSVSETRSMLADASLKLMIGQSPSAWVPSRSFTGYIDEVRLWNTERTADQIRADMFKHLSAGTGLVSSYQMSDGSGTTVTDNSGNGYTGTVGSGTSWVSSPIQYAGNAISFDGIDDYIQIPNQAALDITTAITLEAWVYATNNVGIQNVICKSSFSENSGYIFPRTENGWTSTSLFLHIGGGWQIMEAPFPSLNTWHHLAATYDGATMKIYVNGILAASQAQTGTLSTNSNDLILGNQAGYGEFFGGAADEIRVWNIARSQAAIQADMNRELNPATASGLVAYYKINQGIASGTNTGISFLEDQTGTRNGSLNNFALTGSSSNFVTQNSGLFILPLQWMRFDARRASTNVILEWTTANEVMTRDFIIQHSRDGRNWNHIGQLNASASGQYAFTHVNPGTGYHFYRLQQFDQDGSNQYSDIARIVLSRLASNITLFPNPAYDGFINIQMDQAGLFQLYDLSGRLVWKQMLPEGLRKINTTGLPDGIYYPYSGNSKLPAILILNRKN